MKISVIIPTLNEAKRIGQTLESVTHQPGPCEIIVVDGGSKDDTIALAAPCAQVLTSQPGRARQMNAGAAIATGEVLLFLHADTLLPPDAFSAIRTTLADGTTEGGAFRLAFDADTMLLRFYSFCTRFALPRICFGDRAHFVRSTVFEEIGGFPGVPVFEDLEFVRTLYRRGSFHFLPQAVTTAARRFERYGPLRQQLLNTYLWLRYQTGTAPDRLARFYPYDDK